jgi:hypothetical protein
MLLFSSLAIFAAVVAAPVEELEVVADDTVECEEVVLYDESEEVLDSQEIVFFGDELEGEVETFFEEN